MDMKHLLTLALCCVMAFSAQAQIPSYVPTNGLVGWWPFNGNANDESGNGNHGTVNGATLAADRFGNAGKAYSFDGNDDGISGNGNLSVSNQLSISSWINIRNITQSRIFTFGNSNNIYAFQYSLLTTLNNSNLKAYFIGYGANSNFEPTGPNISTNNLAVNSWCHISVTFGQDTLKFFINGALSGIRIINDIFISNNYSNFLIGKRSDNQEVFNGLLDDIAIYNRALSAAEVQQLYTGQAASAVKSASSLFNYQGLVLNSQKKPLANQSMAVRFTIADSLATYYVETQPLTTDSKGQFATQVGNGIPVQGSMANIPWWDAVPKSLKTEVDTNASGQWITLGQTTMVAVPMAMYAQRTGEGWRSVLGSFDTSANIQSGGGFTVTSIGNNQYEVQFSSAFSDPPNLQVELVGAGTYSYKTISSQVQKFVVQVTGNPDRIQFEAKGK